MSKRNPNAISPVSNGILNTFFILYALACVVPLVIVISISFSNETQIIQQGYGVLPRGFTLNAYQYLFKDPELVGRAYLVTILSTLLGTAFCLLNVALFAYPISRKDFRFRGFFTFFLFFTMLFGGGLVPWYIVVTNLLHLKNNIWALVVPHGFNAFWVIVMRTFYKTTIPDSLIESARIDGAGEWRTYFQIVFPLSLPGLATVGLFTTLAIWNDWFLCMLLTTNEKWMNLNYMIYRALNNMQFLQNIVATMGNAGSSAMSNLPNETFRMAMCVVAIGPIIFAYPFFQKYFIKGLTIGAVKG